jgi:hypothetical protein
LHFPDLEIIHLSLPKKKKKKKLLRAEEPPLVPGLLISVLKRSWPSPTTNRKYMLGEKEKEGSPSANSPAQCIKHGSAPVMLHQLITMTLRRKGKKPQ